MSIFSDDLSDDLEFQKKQKELYKKTAFSLLFILIILSGFFYKYYKLGTQTEKVILSRIEKAVKVAEEKKEKEVSLNYNKKIAEEAANPWQSYKAEDNFGAFVINFPKNWKANVNKDMTASEQFRFLADPNWLMVTKGEKGPYTALKVSVINESYTKKVEDLEYDNRKETIYTISDQAVSGISGKRFSWKNPETKLKAQFILMPFRDKTIYIGTEDYDKNSQTFEEILRKAVINK